MVKKASAGAAAELVREFYAARAAAGADPAPLAEFIADDVRWSEPEVGDHMGALEGRTAVLDMMARAQAATGGTFRLEISDMVETGHHVAAAIHWSARKAGRQIEGREMAVYRVADGRIAAAWFHPENIADDEAFWDN